MPPPTWLNVMKQETAVGSPFGAVARADTRPWLRWLSEMSSRPGANYFGVSDLEALALETHKFESRYLDGLIGPYPAHKTLYDARSPIHHADQITRPLIVFQGLEDKVVLPNQSEMIVDALRQNGIPVAYVPFEGEQHGFRRAENIKRALEAELYFYSRIFGFALAEDIELVTIENL